MITTYEYISFDDDIAVLLRGPDSVKGEKSKNNDQLIRLIDDCLGGTDRIRELMWSSADNGGINSDIAIDNPAGNGAYLSNYLPRKPKEDIADYMQRVQIVTMTPYLSNTIDALTGIALQKPPTIEPELEETDKRWPFFDNMDLQGNGVRSLVCEALNESLSYGMGFFYATTTAISGETIADDKSRPVISVVSLKSIEDFETKTINGVCRVSWVCMRLSKDETKEFFADGTWILKKDDEIVDSGKADAIGIPFFPFYSKKLGLWKSEPPFKELALAQVKDMQKQSALDHGEQFVCFAPFFGSGIEAADLSSQSFGVNRLIHSTNSDAKIQQMDINADGLEQAREGIKANLSRIFTMGISFLSSESGVQKTAQQDRNDRSLENGKLTNTVISIEAALNQALTFAGKLYGDDDLAKTVVTLNKNFNSQAIDPQQIRELRELWMNGAIDHATLLGYLIKGEVIATEKSSEQMLTMRKQEDLSDIGTGD